jgi:ubiquinone biosynthesis protein
LYPQLDLWKTAHPVLQRWMDEQVGGRAVLESLRENLPQLRDALRDLPGVIRLLSEQASQGKLRLNVESGELRHLRQSLQSQHRQRFFIGAGGTLLLCGTLLVGLGTAAALGWALLVSGAGMFWLARPARPR